MRILILGAGKMGSFFCNVLSSIHEVALYDPDPLRLRNTFNAERFNRLCDIKNFRPKLVINCAPLQSTIEAFEQSIPYLPPDCILSDIASVKRGLKDFYAESGFRYVSAHPMFGPTFARLENLAEENAIIINEKGETNAEGLRFYRTLFKSLRLNVQEYTFSLHDEMMAYSLSIPFASTLIFGAVIRHQDVPGTTFKKHMEVARGLLGEDEFLLTEILFNPHTHREIERMREKLSELSEIVDAKDSSRMRLFIDDIRRNIA